MKCKPKEWDERLVKSIKEVEKEMIKARVEKELRGGGNGQS